MGEKRANRLNRSREWSYLQDIFGESSRSRVVLLAVGPYLVHSYWEVISGDIQKIKHGMGDDFKGAQAVLRFHDVTNINYDHTNGHGFFDVDIILQSKNWYVDLWSPDKSYFVDLGFRAEDGSFFLIARSNVAKTPRAWPATGMDEQYASVSEEMHGGMLKTEVHERFLPEERIKAEEADRESPGPAKVRSVGKPVSRPPDVQIWNDPPLDPERRLTQCIQSEYEQIMKPDLTKISENGFAPGVSSRLISPPQGKNDFSDRS